MYFVIAWRSTYILRHPICAHIKIHIFNRPISDKLTIHLGLKPKYTPQELLSRHHGDRQTVEVMISIQPLEMLESADLLLAASLYKGHLYRNHKHLSIERYTPYASASGMLLHKWGRLSMGKLKACR